MTIALDSENTGHLLSFRLHIRNQVSVLSENS